MAVFRRHAPGSNIYTAPGPYGPKTVYPCGLQLYRSTITFMIDAPLVSM